MTSQDPDKSVDISRRTLLKTTGATAFATAAFTGGASARERSFDEIRFCGCGRACVASEEQYRVVYATVDGGETSCRLHCVTSDPRCFTAGSDEKIIGVLDTDGNLFSNPNNCAKKPLDDVDLNDCLDGQEWHHSDTVSYDQTGTHEYEVVDMDVTVRTKRCKSPEKWMDSPTGPPSDGEPPGKDDGRRGIEDFERDSPLDEYWGTENYSVETSTVFEGDQAVTKDTFAAPYSMVSTSGLDYYPEHGDEVTLYFKNASDDNFVAFHFFAQSETDNPDGYTVGISGSSAWKMWKADGNISTIAEQDLPASEQISGWYRVEISTDSTTVYSDLYDDATDTLLASIQADDSTFSSGGIGFRALGNGEVWDGVVRTSTRPLTPDCSIRDPSDGDTVEEAATVQVEATDAEDYDDSLDVEVAIDGGDWQTATYNCSTGYYEYDWDSVGEDDDNHTIYARATDSDDMTTDADPVVVYLPSEPTEPGDFEPGIRHSLYDGPVGGGDGMPSDAVHSPADADIVVSDGDLQSAIDASSRGDLIYVEGSATASEVTQSEITIAGNRGAGDDGHINDPDINATNVTFDGLTVDVADRILITERGWECFNCDISGAGYFDIDQDQLIEPDIEFKQCEIHDLETYKSIQCGYISGDDVDACGNTWHMPSYRNRIRIVYCEWHNNSKIAGTQYYFEAADNHLKNTATSGAFLELRAPNACRVSGSGSLNACGSPCGTGIVQHNLNEMIDDDDQEGVKLLQSRGTPWRDPAYVRRNDAPVNTEWDAGCEANDTFDHAVFADQIALQNAGGEGKDTLDNIVVEDNILS